MDTNTSYTQPAGQAPALALASCSASSTPNVTVNITFPAAWLTPIYNAADEALRGRDLYWMKQLMAKIAIAAANTSKPDHQLRLEGEDGSPNVNAEPRPI